MKHISVIISARVRAVETLCNEIKPWLLEHGLRDEWFAVLMLLRESLNNAVIHGSRNDPCLTVKCEMKCGPKWLRILVEDSGAGFDWVRQMEHMATCDDTCGRGLSIYRLYADKVVFNRRGNRVMLCRRIGGGEKGGGNAD